MKSKFLALALMHVLVACSGGSKKDNLPQSVPDIPQHLDSDLYQSFLKTYENKKGLFDPCDMDLKQQKKEIIQAVLNKEDEINAYYKSMPLAGKDIKKIDFHGSYIEDNSDEKKETESWKSTKTSWKTAIEHLSLVKSKSDLRLWGYLLAETKSLVLEDLRRIVYKSNFDLNYNQEADLKELLTKVQDCHKAESCIELIGLSSAAESLYKTNKIYKAFHELLTASEYSLKDKREIIEILEKRIQNDFEYQFGFTKFGSVQVTQPAAGKFNLSFPLSSQTLSEAEKSLIQNWIQDAWKSDDNAVTVTWNETPSYSIFFDEGLLMRAYTSFKKAEIHLFPGTRLSAIPHEFGHAMGFPDEYYTLFDASACGYEIWFNPGSIMSDDSTGIALPRHWEKLRSEYGTGVTL